MKKIYFSLIAILFSVVSFAQTTVFTATFDDLNGSGGNDGLWSGNIASFTTNLSSYTSAGWDVSGNVYYGNYCLKGGSSTKKGVVVTPAITTTGKTLTLTFRAGAWAGDATTLDVSTSSGTLSQSSVTLNDSAFSSYSITITGASSGLKITFSGDVASKNRFFLDDIKVVESSTLGLSDISKTKNIFLRNTLVDNTLSFQTKGNATVRVYNTNGQLVKTANVSAQNANVNVANLPKGNYVVTAESSGEKISQKVIKK